MIPSVEIKIGKIIEENHRDFGKFALHVAVISKVTNTKIFDETYGPYDSRDEAKIRSMEIIKDLAKIALSNIDLEKIETSSTIH